MSKRDKTGSVGLTCGREDQAKEDRSLAGGCERGLLGGGDILEAET